MKQVNLKEILLQSFRDYVKENPESRLAKKYTIEQFEASVDIMTVGERALQEACNQAIDLCAENAELYYYDSESDVPEGEISTGDSEYGYYSLSKKSILNTKKQII